MPDFLAVICIIGLVVLVLTLVGHGLWVFLAFVFRGFQPKKARTHTCVFCGRQTDIGSRQCHWCGKEQDSPLALELRDLEAVVRQLRRFEKSGELTSANITNLLTRVKEYRDGLLHPHAAPKRAEKAEPAVKAPPVVEPFLASRTLTTKLPETKLPETPLVAVEVVEDPARGSEEERKPAVAEVFAKTRAAEVKLSGGATESARSVAIRKPRPTPIRPPRKSFGELLGSFLEERNIHLTELVGVLLGGLLMVGASVMFVIAYWNRLENVPIYKFSIFVGYSTIVCLAGLFVFHRWKLQATGRGLMTIGILLAPLNFLAMASSPGSILILAAELIALGVFAWLVAFAGKSLTRDGQWPLVAAVIGNSVLILLVGQFLGAVSSPLAWMAFGLLAAGLCTAPAMWHFHQVNGVNPASFEEMKTAAPCNISIILQTVNSLFMVLAVAVYSTALSMSLIVVKASKLPQMNLQMALQLLTTPLCLAATAMLCTGLYLHRKMPRDAKLEGHRTVATTIGLVGVFLQVAALVLAWPQPLVIAGVGIIAAGCLAYMAMRYDFPVAHAGAMIGVAVAYLAVFYVLFDEKLHGMQNGTFLIASASLGRDLLNLMISARSGTALGGLFGAFALISEYFARRGRKEHGAIYAAGSCVVAVLGLMLVTAHGWIGKLDEDVRAAILYAFYGIVSVLLSLRWNRKLLSYLGGNLLAVAPFWLLNDFSLAVWKDDLALAGCLFWAALAWFALAWRHRSELMLTLQQIVLSVASLFAAFAWLLHQDWLTSANLPGDLGKVYNLQAFGVALAAISLLWMIIRIVTRGSERMQKLLNPGWLPVDKIIGCGLVLLQAFSLAPFLYKGVWYEIQLSGTLPYLQSYCGPTAWTLLLMLAAIQVIALWDRWETSNLLCSLILAACVPCLIAGCFTTQAANASALRWGLAAMFVLISAVIWCRDGTQKALIALGAKFELSTDAALFARVVAAVLTAVPVVAITVFMAIEQLQGTAPAGPTAKSFFANLGPSVSYLVPLVLVIVGTVGHALRESSALNAFLAGLVVELAVMLGYPLYFSTSVPAQKFGTTEFMVWIQLMTIAAASWAIGWLVARRWVNVWREDSTSKKNSSPSPSMSTASVGMTPLVQLLIPKTTVSLSAWLMTVQFGFGVLGNALLIGIAMLEVIFLYPITSFARTPHFAAAEGMPLGWTALALTAVVYAYRAMQRGRSFSPHAVGWVGMSVLALVACTVTNLPMPEGVVMNGHWAYRVLLTGWATYALLVAVLTWWVASQRTMPDAEGPPQAILRLAAVWVRVAGIAAVLLGLKAGFLHDNVDAERLWAAAGIAIAAMAGATMGVWRRREGWAFCAALGVNLAASLVVWHVEEMRNLFFGDWWLRLVQANIIASSSVALVWLTAHRRLYQLRDWSVRQSPLLAVQIVLPIAGLAGILLVPVISLVQHPQGLSAWMHDFAGGAGWLSLLLPSVAAAWYLQRTLPGRLIHAAAGFGMAAGVLVACQAHAFKMPGSFEWMEYRMLFASWTAASLLLLVITFAANARRPAFLSNWDLAKHLSADLAKTWISALSLFAALLITRSCAFDVAGIWWSLVAIAVLSFTVGAMAIWLRSAEHVFFSGLLLNLAGVVAWFAWGEKSTVNLWAIQVLCLAAAATIWTLLDIFSRGRVPHLPIGSGDKSKFFPFAQLAIAIGVFFLAAPTVYGVFSDLNGEAYFVLSKLSWIAVAAVAGVFGLMLWDRRTAYPWLGLYLTGIIAIAMHWHSKSFEADMIYWRAGSDLAGFSLVAALIGWFMPLVRRFGRYLLIPDGENRWAGDWFGSLQAFLITVISLLCVWMAVDFRFAGLGKEVGLFGLYGRAAGVTGLLMILGATILMAAQSSRGIRQYWQSAAFVVGLLFMASVRWAGLDPSDSLMASAPWMHRSISLLLAAAMMCLLTTFGLPQVGKRLWAPLFPASPANPKQTWTDAGRKILPYFAGLTVALLAVVLVQEGWHFNRASGTPVTLSETLVVGGVMAVMLVLTLVFALRTDFDPLKLSENGRQAYVYAAEVLAALIGLHVWMTHPHLFQFGIIKKYWMFIVMGVAFAGASLSEIFHRRKLPVLSVPLERTALLLPILPAVGFWLFAPGDMHWELWGRTPLVWFLIGGFYAAAAYMRRSWVCGLLAVLTANVGLWTTLWIGEISFLEHPQLWLIPIAVCALVAEFMNHDRLSKAQSTTFRYLALSTIYVSSTADMFIAGIGQNFWLPIILMLLSVGGALLGVLRKIRSFLILGIVFLVIDMLSLIRYAAVDLQQTWLWYLSAILLGAAIIAVFAFFEKRRNDILAAMEKLKKWER